MELISHIAAEDEEESENESLSAHSDDENQVESSQSKKRKRPVEDADTRYIVITEFNQQFILY